MNKEDQHDDLGFLVLNDHCEEIEQVMHSLVKCTICIIFVTGCISLGVYISSK